MGYIRYSIRLFKQGTNPAISPPDRVLPTDAGYGNLLWIKEGPPGYVGTTLTIGRAESDAHPTVYVHGTTLEIVNTADSNNVVWAGKLLKPRPGIGTDRVKLVAHGWGKRAGKTIRKWLWQTRDESEWYPGDSDPFNYQVSSLIEARVEGRRLEFRVKKNTTFKKTGGGSPATWRSVLVFYGDGRNLRRLAFNWEQDHDDAYYLEVCKATGPDGALTVVDTIGLGASSGSYNPGSVTNWDTNPFDLFALRLCRDDEEKKSDGWWLRIKNVRVNATHTAADSYETYKIIKDIADEVGGTTTGIATTTTNGIPFAPGRVFASEALVEVAMQDDRIWALYGDASGPAWRYRDWSARIWEITDPHITFEPTSVERISKVWCPYQTSDGVARFTSAEVPGAEGIITEFTIPLTDPLPPKSAADVVCAVFAAYYAVDRSFGTVQTAWIEDTANPGVAVAATRANPGDTIRIGGIDYRCGRAEGVEGPAVRFTFPELDYVLQRFLARRQLLLARGRSNRKATIDALGLGRPALVDKLTIAGTFKRHRKKNHHTQVDLRGDWDPVTLDLRGDPTVVRAYRVQERPVDGLGVPIPESAGGKILEKTIRDKDLGDSETLDTRIWFRDIERPFAWDREIRIETIDIQGKTSKNGTKSFTDWVNLSHPGSAFDPPPPTGITCDVDPHNTTAVITQPADDEDAQDVDDRIHRTTFVLLKNGAEVRRDTVRAGVLRKTWRINAAPGDDFDLEVYNRDSENRRSTSVTDLNNNIASPPDPVSAPSVTIDKGGRKKRRITVTGTYAGSWTDADVRTAHIRATIGSKTYNPKIRLDSGGQFSHVFHGLDKGDAYDVKYRVEDTKGNESGFSPSETGTLTDKVPGKVTGKTITPKTRAIVVKYTPPAAWSDGTTTDWSIEEVQHYVIVVKNSGGAEVARDNQHKGTTKSFPFTRAEIAALALPLKADVTAVGWNGDDAGAETTAATGSPEDKNHRHAAGAHTHGAGGNHHHAKGQHKHGKGQHKHGKGRHSHDKWHKHWWDHDHKFSRDAGHAHGGSTGNVAGHGHGGLTGTAGGGGGAHQHSISSSPDHDHSITTKPAHIHGQVVDGADDAAEGTKGRVSASFGTGEASSTMGQPLSASGAPSSDTGLNDAADTDLDALVDTDYDAAADTGDASGGTTATGSGDTANDVEV